MKQFGNPNPARERPADVTAYQTVNAGRLEGGWQWAGGTGTIEAVRISGSSGAIDGGQMLVYGASH